MAARKKSKPRRKKSPRSAAERRREALRPKTFRELMEEQGTGPLDVDAWLAKSPGPFYEGFEEDVKAMRRGRGPIKGGSE